MIRGKLEQFHVDIFHKSDNYAWSEKMNREQKGKWIQNSIITVIILNFRNDRNEKEKLFYILTFSSFLYFSFEKVKNL